jgi:hypothetical protein
MPLYLLPYLYFQIALAGLAISAPHLGNAGTE